MLTELPKGLKLMELTAEKAMEMYDKMNSIRGLFDDYTKNNMNAFIANVRSLNSLWMETEDGTGLLYLLQVMKGLSANAHFVFWDKHLRGREELCRAALRYAMSNIPLVKVNVYLPDYASLLGRFIHGCGFRKEGKIRRWSISNGKMYDVVVYGITYEEAYNNGTGISGLHESTDATNGRERVRSVRDGLLQQHGAEPEPSPSTSIQPQRPAEPSEPAEHQPNAELNQSVWTGYGEVLIRDDAERGETEHSTPDGPVPATAGHESGADKS